MNPVLERLHANLFTQPYASDGKVNGVFSFARRVPLSVALKKPNIQINGPRRISYLAFDIDREWGGLAWEDANLPPPNIIITNPTNGHAHLVYELQEPVWLPKKDDPRPGMPLPVRYLKAAQKAMGRALGSDPYYTGLLVKNPLHASWIVSYPCSRPYNLATLTRHLELFDEPPRQFKTDDALLCGLIQGSRYITLFEIVRKISYKLVRYHGSLESFRFAIEEQLDRFNALCDVPLPNSEIRDLKNKISKWTWTKLSQKRRCKISVNASDTLSDKQRKSQQRTSTIRVAKSLDKIVSAIRHILSQDIRLTKVAVSRLSNLDRKTVSIHWQEALGQIESIPSVTPPSLIEETEGLRPKSLLGPCGASAASPRGGYSVCSSQLPNSDDTFGEIVAETIARHGSRVRGFIAGMQRAWELARVGVLLRGLPEKYMSSVVSLILDYQQGSPHAVPT